MIHDQNLHIDCMYTLFLIVIIGFANVIIVDIGFVDSLWRVNTLHRTLLDWFVFSDGEAKQRHTIWFYYCGLIKDQFTLNSILLL